MTRNTVDEMDEEAYTENGPPSATLHGRPASCGTSRGPHPIAVGSSADDEWAGGHVVLLSPQSGRRTEESHLGEDASPNRIPGRSTGRTISVRSGTAGAAAVSWEAFFSRLSCGRRNHPEEVGAVVAYSSSTISASLCIGAKTPYTTESSTA